MAPEISRFFSFSAALTLATSLALAAADQPRPSVLVGAAKADITPDLPIRLSGYGSRTTETNRVETRLFARALAIGTDDQKPVVLLTIELIGIGEESSDTVAAALRESHGIDRA